MFCERTFSSDEIHHEKSLCLIESSIAHRRDRKITKHRERNTSTENTHGWQKKKESRFSLPFLFDRRRKNSVGGLARCQKSYLSIHSTSHDLVQQFKVQYCQPMMRVTICLLFGSPAQWIDVSMRTMRKSSPVD